MTQLVLSVSRSSMRVIPHLHHGTRKDPQLADAREDVLGQPRFAKRCLFCDYQFGRIADECEVHHIDGDHGNSAPENLAPACVFCHMATHLDQVAKRWPNDPGQMIWLPELTQEQLSSLVQAIVFALAMQAQASGDRDFVPLVATSGSAISPYTVYTRLAARSAQIEAMAPGEPRVREGMSQPAVAARVLQAMSAEDYARRGELLAGVRYLPPIEPFIEQAKLWPMDSGAFSRLDLASWASISNTGDSDVD